MLNDIIERRIVRMALSHCIEISADEYKNSMICIMTKPHLKF